jgi:hypothetical protein
MAFTARMLAILILRWLVSAALMLVGGWAILGNWVIACTRSGSLIPFFGGIFVAVGIVVLPIEGIRGLWWIPLLIDLGCMPVLLMTGVFLLWKRYTGSGE